MSRVIAVGMDQAAFPAREALLSFVRSADSAAEALYCGPDSAQRVDYTDFAQRVAELVARGGAEKGILVCGTGIGMSIAANKVAGVRAALCHDHFTARMARVHNDANVLCVGYRVTGEEVIREIIEVFLNTPFSGEERHARRIGKIASLEMSGKK